MEAEELHGQTSIEGAAKSGDNLAKSGDNPAKHGDNPAKSGENPAKSDTPAKSGENPSKSDTPAKSGENPAKSSDDPAKSGDNLSDSASISTEGVSSRMDHDSMGGSCAEVSSAAKEDQTSKDTDQTKDEQVVQDKTTNNEALPRHQEESNKPDGQQDTDGEICDNSKLTLPDDLQDGSKEQSVTKASDTVNAASKLDGKSDSEKLSSDGKKHICENEDICEPSTSVHNDTLKPLTNKFVVDKPVLKVLGSSKDTVETKQPSNVFSPVTLNSAVDKVVKGLGSSKETVETKQPSNIFSPVTLNSAVDKVVKCLGSSKDTVETKQPSNVFSPVTLNSAVDKVVKGLESSKDTVETKQPSNVFSPVTLNSAVDQVVKGLWSPEDTRGSKLKKSSNSSVIIDNSVSTTSGSSEDKAKNLGISEDTVYNGSTSKEPCQQSSALPSLINRVNESVIGGAEDPVDEGSEDEGALHIDCPEPGMSEGSNKPSDISQDAVGDKDMSDGIQLSERSSTQTDEMYSSRSPEAKETTNSTGLTDSLGQSGDTEKTVESTSDKTQGCNIFDSFKAINTANDNMKSQSSVRNLESSALKLTDLKIKLERYKALNRTWQTRNPDRTNLFESFSANIPTSKDMDENSLLQKDGDSRSEHKTEEQQEKAKEKNDLNSTGHESVCINSDAKNTSGGGEIAGDKSMELTRSTDKTHKDHNVFKTHKEHNFADDSTALQQELASLNDLLGSNTGDVSRKVIQENPSMPNLLDIGQKSKPNFKNKDMQKSEQEHKSKENVPVNEEELSEEEQNLKICRIFSLQAKSNSQENESQKKISKEPANTKTNHNESLMDILNLDKDYTASAQPTPVPQKPADVNWGVMGANRCQRCNFTTSDESLLQVHTCRRQSLGSQNPSTPPARQPLPSETSKTSTPPQISSHKSAPQAPISSTSGTKTIQPKKTTQKIKLLPPTPKVFGKDIVCRIISLGNEKFLCTLCKYTETVPVFVGHLVEHMQEFPYSCPYCTEKGILLFQTSAQITAHINSHTQAQPKFNIFSFSKAKAFLEECKARGSNTLTGIWIEPNKVLTTEEAVRNSSRKILPNTSQRVAVSAASTLPQANSVHSTASVQNRVPASTNKGNPYLSNPAFQSPPNVDVSNKLISNLLTSNTTGNPNPAFQGPPNVAGSNKFISNILASNTTGNPNPAFQGPPNVDVSNNFISNLLASNTTGNQLLLLLPNNPSGTQQIVQPRNILPSTIQSTPALTTTGANVSSMHQSSTQQSAIPLSVTQQIVQPRNILPSTIQSTPALTTTGANVSSMHQSSTQQSAIPLSVTQQIVQPRNILPCTIQSTQALNTTGANVSSMHQSCTQQSAIPLSVASITAIPSNVVLPTKVTLAAGGVPTSADQALIPRTQTPANTLSSAAPSTSVNTSPSVLQAAGVRTLTPANSSSQTFPAFVPSVSGLATSTSGPQVTGARAGTPTTSTTLSAAASVTSAITVPRPTTAASSQPNLSKVMVARNGKRFLLSRNGNRWLCNGYPGECKFSTELLPLFKAHILNHLHEDNEACQHPSASQNGELSQTCPHVEQVIKSFTDEKTDRPPSSSAIPNQDLKDTASGSSGSTEPTPAIQKAEDDGSDSDCEVIEVAKKEAPLIDLTEDDSPESSEKAGISNDHSSTTSEPELRIGTSFSLRSNENVSADQTIPDNEANTQGANTTQPVERRPNTPKPTGQGVQPEQDDQRKSMFY